MKIPLSWRQLTHERIRFLVALAGITFADVLMFMQLGFRDALLNSSIRFHKSLQGDIFVIHSKSDTFVALKSFSQRRLYEVVGIEGVQQVTPTYVGFGFWKNPVKRNTRNVLIVGINPDHLIIDLPGLAQNFDKIKQQDTVLFDEKSRDEFGPIAEWFKEGKTVKTEISNREVTVKGLFELGTSFGADGNVITSDVNFWRIFSGRDRGLVDLGVIQLEPSANVDAVLETVRAKLDQGDVKVFSKSEFLEYEKHYWQTRTAIGFVFTLGTIMGFIVGIVIVYQILYTDVADHLPEYATLKAMGYTDRYLLWVVFQEAIILGVIGFLPGLGFSLVMYFNAARSTGLPIIMTVTRALTVLILTIVMCCLSGGVAVGKLRAADPADIF